MKTFKIPMALFFALYAIPVLAQTYHFRPDGSYTIDPAPPAQSYIARPLPNGAYALTPSYRFHVPNVPMVPVRPAPRLPYAGAAQLPGQGFINNPPVPPRMPCGNLFGCQ